MMEKDEVISDLAGLWSATLGELEVLVSKANFSTWFKNTGLIAVENKNGIVKVPSNFIKTWLQSKFHKQIVSTLRKLTDDAIMSVSYVIKPPTQPMIFDIVPQEANGSTSQNPNLRSDYTFETFVVGVSNRLAYTTAQSVAETPGRRHNPLFIYGDVGLGKTHLLHAIGNYIKENFKNKKVLYISCEDFTNEYIESLRKKVIDVFKKKYRGVDVFLVDDIQFLARKEGTQEEFFHTFNALHRKEAQIVMTADKLPREIPHLEGRLSSRFGGGMVADIQTPNIETRQAILREKAISKKFELENDIVEYIATSISSNIRELEGALNRLIAQCEMLNEPPTLPLVKKVLKDLAAVEATQKINPVIIIDHVCRYYDVSLEDIGSKRRHKEIVRPRQIAMYLIRSELGTSFPDIGKVLGGKDHTTIMHGYRVMVSRIKQDDQLREEISKVKDIIYEKDKVA